MRANALAVTTGSRFARNYPRRAVALFVGFTGALGNGEHEPMVAPDVTRLRPSWHHAAACRGHLELFYVTPGGNGYRAALELCHGCPVAIECRAEAVEFEVVPEGVYGVRAGLLPHERQERIVAARERAVGH